jgi:hypothetical protein
MNLQPAELENELICLDNDPDQPDDKDVDEDKSTSPDTKETTNKQLQSNTVGLFGPGVSQFWVKKKRQQTKPRVRRGLTKGMKLPANVENLLCKNIRSHDNFIYNCSKLSKFILFLAFIFPFPALY